LENKASKSLKGGVRFTKRSLKRPRSAKRTRETAVGNKAFPFNGSSLKKTPEKTGRKNWQSFGQRGWRGKKKLAKIRPGKSGVFSGGPNCKTQVKKKKQ